MVISLCQECKTSTTLAAIALRLPWSLAALNSLRQLIYQVTGETIARHFSTTYGRSVEQALLIVVACQVDEPTGCMFDYRDVKLLLIFRLGMLIPGYFESRDLNRQSRDPKGPKQTHLRRVG